MTSVSKKRLLLIPPAHADDGHKDELIFPSMSHHFVILS